jgi:hypothetical protein
MGNNQTNLAQIIQLHQESLQKASSALKWSVLLSEKIYAHYNPKNSPIFSFILTIIYLLT